MYSQTITTPYEVIKYSALSDDTGTGIIRTMLLLDEHSLFRKHFGIEFYQTLKNDLTEPYKNGGEADKYYEGGSYTTGDVVFYGENLYISLADTNTELPTNEQAWQKIEKFEKECYNRLWGFARFWVANYVGAGVLQPTTHKAGSRGVTKTKAPSSDGGAESVNFRELQARINAMQKRSERAFEELFWMMVSDTELYEKTDGVEGCDYSYIERVKQSCGGTSASRSMTKKRRVASKRAGNWRTKQY